MINGWFRPKLEAPYPHPRWPHWLQCPELLPGSPLPPAAGIRLSLTQAN